MQPELAKQMNSPAIDPALKPPAAETGSSSARNPAARRLRILEAATRLFLDEGYGQATTNALVRIVGGSKATLYSHFPSKEQLFGAVGGWAVGLVHHRHAAPMAVMMLACMSISLVTQLLISRWRAAT